MTEMFDAVHAYAAKSLEKYYIGEYVEDQVCVCMCVCVGMYDCGQVWGAMMTRLHVYL